MSLTAWAAKAGNRVRLHPGCLSLSEQRVTLGQERMRIGGGMSRGALALVLVTGVLSLVAIGWITWVVVQPTYWFAGAYAPKGETGDRGPVGPAGPAGPAGPVGPDAEEALLGVSSQVDDASAQLDDLSAQVQDISSRLTTWREASAQLKSNRKSTSSPRRFKISATRWKTRAQR